MVPGQAAASSVQASRSSRSAGEAMDLLDAIATTCCGSMEMSVFLCSQPCVDLCLKEGVSAIPSIYRPAKALAYVSIGLASAWRSSVRLQNVCSVRACPAGGGTPMMHKFPTMERTTSGHLRSSHASNLGLLRRLTKTKTKTKPKRCCEL
jgi:hypothetical protein